MEQSTTLGQHEESRSAQPSHAGAGAPEGSPGRPVAIVTGGAGAFGAAAARALAATGHIAVIADLDGDRAAEVAAMIEGAVPVRVNLTDEASIERAVGEIVERLGRIDVLVNNAGSLPVGDVAATDAALFDGTVALNLRGTYLMSRAALPHLRRSPNARIVMMGSRTWLAGGNPAYSASKAGMVGLARALVHELAPTGGTVNVVAPGPVATPLVSGDDAAKRAAFERYAAATPLGRVATPEDVGAAVAFFAGPGASFITGEVLHVAGGLQLAPKL